MNLVRRTLGRDATMRRLVAIRRADVEFEQADARSFDQFGQTHRLIKVGENQASCHVGVQGSRFLVECRDGGNPVLAGARLQAGATQDIGAAPGTPFLQHPFV